MNQKRLLRQGREDGGMLQQLLETFPTPLALLMIVLCAVQGMKLNARRSGHCDLLDRLQSSLPKGEFLLPVVHRESVITYSL